MSTNNGTAPVYENSDDLPADFVIEDVCPLNEEQTRHRVAFYQSALTKFSKQANNGGMLFREQFTRIRDAMICLHNGEKASSLKAEYSQIHPWLKKFGIMVVADSLVLVCRNRKKHNKSSDGEGWEDNNVEEEDAPDQDRFLQPTYMERLYGDMLGQHAGHNMNDTFRHKLATKFLNISNVWVKLFTQTCPGCIVKARVPEPVAGLRNIITNGFGVRGQCVIA
jgi:hypothetical protein